MSTFAVCLACSCSVLCFCLLQADTFGIVLPVELALANGSDEITSGAGTTPTTPISPGSEATRKEIEVCTMSAICFHLTFWCDINEYSETALHCVVF